LNRLVIAVAERGRQPGGVALVSRLGTLATFGKRTSSNSFCFWRIASVTLFALRVREV
jgi:hypothetical protein